MSAAFQQILRLLPKIEPGEKKALLIKLKGSADAQAATPTPTPAQDWLLDGILHVLQRRGLSYNRTSPADIKKLAPNYSEDAALVRQQLETALRVQLPRAKYVELQALGISVASALTARLSRQNINLGLKPMLLNISHVLEAVEGSFPGYISTGMISVLVRRSTVGSKGATDK